MAEPKFHVGQHVAVCNFDCSCVIPQAVVVDLRHSIEVEGPHPFRPGVWVGPYTGWGYRTTASAYWFRESSLRPISPDTEYLPTSTETPTEVEQ